MKDYYDKLPRKNNPCISWTYVIHPQFGPVVEAFIVIKSQGIVYEDIKYISQINYDIPEIRKDFHDMLERVYQDKASTLVDPKWEHADDELRALMMDDDADDVASFHEAIEDEKNGNLYHRDGTKLTKEEL